MENCRQKISLIAIECALGIEPPALYCPRTGHVVLRPGADVEQPASPYVTFVYHSDCDFIYLREDLEGRLNEKRAEISAANPDEYDDVDDVPYDMETLLEHVFLGEVPLVYKVSSKYLACGPVDETVYVGFDLWPLSEQEGENDDCDDEEEG